MSAAAISLQGLRKRFDGKVVLDGIDLEVQPGEIVGYVGPNGAGKSTTIKILLGLMQEFEGEARGAGFDPKRDPLEIKKRVGYVAENAVLFDSMTIGEFLLFVGRMHELEDAVIVRRATPCLEAFDLAQRVSSPISELSKGMRQKVLLSAALVHAPKILFLDEPMSGLDVHSQILVKEVVRNLAKRGSAILFSSHVMDVVERLCDRIAILSAGKIVAHGSFEQLSSQLRGSSLESIFAEVTGEGDVAELAVRVAEAVSS